MLAEGELGEPVRVHPGELARMASEAAKRAAGLFRPTKRTEVAWIDGERELAVGLVGIEVETLDGVVVISLPVRCDQTGRETVHVTFVVGAPDRPAGLYAATGTRPRGPALIVDTWGGALVAFAWQVLLGVVSELAGATGKDARGNRLIPAGIEATADALMIAPMARHRFAGASGLVGKPR